MSKPKMIDVHKSKASFGDGKRLIVPKSRKRTKILKIFLIFVISFTLLSTAVLYMALRNLPDIESLKNYRPATITEVFDINKKKIGEFATERRMVIPLENIPPLLKNAFIASEDDRFYEHKGLDWHGIVRAFFINMLAGEVKQGGSTITQQVAKSLLLSPEKSITRKIREAVLAFRMEKNLTKDEILFLYLNQIYLGHGAYGVYAAGENYFDKKPYELDLAEMAMLAGLVQAPSRYNPFTHMDRAKGRQLDVLEKMLENKFITKEQKEAASKEEIKLSQKGDTTKTAAPYFTENVRKYLVAKYGNEAVLTQGMKIYTTLDLRMQKAAEKALKTGLQELDKRQGYRGPLETIAEPEITKQIESLKDKNKDVDPDAGEFFHAVVLKTDDEKKLVRIHLGDREGTILLDDMKWARKPDPEVRSDWVYIEKPSLALKSGDLILVAPRKSGFVPDNLKTIKKNLEPFYLLEQEPQVEGVIVAMDIQTGFIKAMVGGYDFKKSEFNRATQAMRQPGSAFKPIIYSAAIDKGYTAARMIVDAPVVYDNPVEEQQWKPKNIGGKFSGNIIFRDALIKSQNVPTIRIVEDLGIDYTIDYARKLGIVSPLTRDFSLALGTSILTPLELTRTYSVFASGGKIVQPIFIRKIEDRDGKVLEENIPEPSLAPKQDSVNPEAASSVEPQVSPTPETAQNPPETNQENKTDNDTSQTAKHFLPGGAISLETAYIVTHLLKEVVHYGTGYRVKALGRPAAGKTGTTNDSVDTWFVGYTPDLVATVWVGFDEKKPLGKGEVGGATASPIWLDFMKEALAGSPVKDFTVPEGIVFVQIDPKTGNPVSDKSSSGIFEAFLEGTEPAKSKEKEKDSQIKNFFTEDR